MNDSLKHAEALSCLLGGIPCRVNLIRFHAIPNVSLETSDIVKMEAFRDFLNAKGVVCTIRASRGEDIFRRLWNAFYREKMLHLYNIKHTGMKTRSLFIGMLLLLVLMGACNSGSVMTQATGFAYEVVVVMDQRIGKAPREKP